MLPQVGSPAISPGKCRHQTSAQPSALTSEGKTLRGSAGLNRVNLQSQVCGEQVRNERSIRAEDEGQTWDVTRQEAVSMAKQRYGNNEMERDGAVDWHCCTGDASAVPLTEMSLAGLSNAWSCYSFPKHSYFTSHTTENKALETWCDVFQMLFLTCFLPIKANQHPAFSSANQNGKLQLWGMVLQRWNVIATNIQSHACLSVLEQIPSALAATTLSAAISTTSPLAQALCCTLLAETTLPDTKTTCHGRQSLGVLSDRNEKNTDKKLHLSHFHSWRFDALTPSPYPQCLNARHRSKTGWNWCYSLNYSQLQDRI